MFLFFADEGTPKLTRREVLSDLSGGFCRNWGLAGIRQKIKNDTSRGSLTLQSPSSTMLCTWLAKTEDSFQVIIMPPVSQSN